MRKASFVLLIVIGSAITLPAEEKGLIGYWSFENIDGTTVEDASGKGNSAILARNGANTKQVDGKKGKGMLFTTDNPKITKNKGCMKVNVPDDCDFSKGITIQGWIKLKNNQNGTREIVSNALSDRGPGFRLMVSHGSIRFLSGDGKKLWGAILRFSNKRDTWYFIVATYNGSIFKVYAFESGVEPGKGKFKEAAISKPNLSLTKGYDSIFVGAYRGGYAYSFDGVIDELKIYNYAKNGMEILDVVDAVMKRK